MRKYLRPKKRNLDQTKVSEFLKGIGFETERIEQPWRHLIVFGKYRGKDAVFKLASTLTTSPQTKNEFYWNRAVHSVPEVFRTSFTVPNNYANGEYNRLFYFIAERFLSEHLIKDDSDDLSRVSENLRQIALVTKEIEALPIPLDSEFAISQNSKSKKPIGESLLTSATEWASQVDLNLEPFLRIIEKNKNILRTCVGHGDFVPRQMYKINGKIGIIDGEHAGIKGPLYYDVAYFYLRLISQHGAFELGRKYIQEFYKLLTSEDQKTFWEELKPPLIQRYIGNLWDNKNIYEIENMQKLGDRILDDSLFECSS